MEGCPQSIIPVRSRDARDLVLPVQPAQSPQTLSNDRFFVIDLLRVPDVLPMTTSLRFVIRSIRLLAIGRRFENLRQFCNRVIFLPFDNFRVDYVSRRRPGNKHHTLPGPCQTISAINQFFDGQLHKSAPRSGARTLARGTRSLAYPWKEY